MNTCSKCGSALRAVAARNRRVQRRSEQCEINELVQTLQIVALGRQYRQPFVLAEETGSPFRHACNRIDHMIRASAQ